MPIAYVLIVGEYVRLGKDKELTINKLLIHLYVEPIILIFVFIKNKLKNGKEKNNPKL